MSLISDIFAETILDYVTREGESDSRLLMPAPTEKIGRSLQRKLVELLPSDIPTYLVVDPSKNQPSEELGWISAEGITSLRLGSFVLIVQPGNISRIPESVMRAANASFNDEWPWSLAGESKHFSFKFSILPKIVEKSDWALCKSQNDVIISLLGGYVLDALAGSSERNEILFDDIIDGFDVGSQSSLEDNYLRFLFHLGIPNVKTESSDNIDNFKVFQKDCIKLFQKITDTTRASVIESLEHDQDLKLINGVYDGFGSNITNGSGILSLRKSLKFLSDDLWASLTLDKFFDLFDIEKERKYALEAEFKSIEEEDFSELYISPKRDHLIIKEGSSFKVSCNWDLGGSTDEINDAAESNFKLEVRLGRKILQSYPSSSYLANNDGHNFEFNVSDEMLFGEKNSGKTKKISVCITATNEVIFKKVLSIKMLCSDYSEVLVVEEPFKIFDYDGSDDHRELVTAELPSPSNIVILTTQEKSGTSLVGFDEKNIKLNSLDNTSIGQISVDAIDPSAYSSGSVEIKAVFPNGREIFVDLKSLGISKGLFSIEEVLTAELIKDRSDKEELYEIFTGTSLSPYSKLGGLTDENAYRVSLSKRMEENRGAIPIILPLAMNLSPDLVGLGSVIIDRSFQLNETQFSFDRKGEAETLLELYQQARKALINFYAKHFGDENSSSKHPLYARVPTYIHDKKLEIEPLILNYLVRHKSILEALAKKTLNRAEEFVLSYLDCVVLADNNPRNKDISDHEIFLIGPWHPLQVADRFQRQQTKFQAAHYCIHSPKSGVNKLAGILDDLSGIRSVSGFNGHNNFVQSYVSDSSDLGWSVALKIKGDTHDFSSYSAAVSRIFDLQISAIPDSSSAQTKSYIRDFMAANPAERRLEIYVRNGLNINEIHSSVAELLYSEDNNLRRQLSGGVHLYFQNLDINQLSEVEWDVPPICIYDVGMDGEEKCLEENHIDIFIVAPNKGFKTRTINPNKYIHLPRGVGPNASMSLVLSQLVDGAQGMSNSIYQETPYLELNTDNVVTDAYLACTQLMPSLVNDIGFQTEQSVILPEGLAASWVILPGNATDPAMLSRYVNSSTQTENQRVLWEYNVDLTAGRSDYFILSEIASGFEQALSTSKFRNFDKNRIVSDLSRVGIAVGGEALRTGMKALGVIGQVGAVRLFSPSRDDAPLRDSRSQIGLIIPVDSFDSILGSKSQTKEGSNKKSDLLAIQLSLDKSNESELIISAASIEAKFASSIYGDDKSAFDQAKQTFERFKDLVDGSTDSAGVIQRFILSRLVRYGLQLKHDSTAEEYVTRNYKIIDNILKGQIRWRKPEHGVIVCSTEGEITSTSHKYQLGGNGLRIRLAPNEWPGENESENNLIQLRAKLRTIFDSGVTTQIPTPTSEPISKSEPLVISEPKVTSEPTVESELTVQSGIEPESVSLENSEHDSLSKISDKEIQKNYDKLLNALVQRGVAVYRPEDGEPFIIEGPASVLYRLDLEFNVDPKKLEAQQDILSINFRLEENQKVRIYQHRGSMHIDVPKQPHERYFVNAQWLWARWKRPVSGLAVPLGINQRKEIIDINFSASESPHLLIGGTTGGGKSEALTTILRGLLEYYSQSELGLIMVDPKGNELIEFENSPYLIRPLGTNASDALESLNKCVNEMEHRNKVLFTTASRAQGRKINSLTAYNKVVDQADKLPWWLIVLDEYYDLTSDPEDKKHVEQLLGRLAAKARSAGIHIIIATQKPTAEVINSTLRSNLPAQLALSVKSSRESLVIMDAKGAEVLNGSGDAFLRLGGKLNRLQCAMVAEEF